MQIVIDISEQEFKALKEDMADPSWNFYKSIKQAIIIPKGHGRLGDLSKIYVELNEAQIEGTSEYKGLGAAKQIICDAHTIIEADKAESEE